MRLFVSYYVSSILQPFQSKYVYNNRTVSKICKHRPQTIAKDIYHIALLPYLLRLTMISNPTILTKFGVLIQ